MQQFHFRGDFKHVGCLESDLFIEIAENVTYYVITINKKILDTNKIYFYCPLSAKYTELIHWHLKYNVTLNKYDKVHLYKIYWLSNKRLNNTHTGFYKYSIINVQK